MQTVDFTMALARLLSDARLRSSFARDPARVTDALGVHPEERSLVLALSSAELEAQAATLLDKRRDEALAWLPRTCRALGSDLQQAFEEHALANWGEEPSRGLLDALSFCRWLIVRGDRRACPVEEHRLAFLTSRLRWSVCLLRGANIGGRRRTVVHCMMRSRTNVPRELTLYLAFGPRCGR